MVLSDLLCPMPQRPAKMVLLGSDTTSDGDALPTRTHERSSSGQVNDWAGPPITGYWDIRQLSVYLGVKPSTLYAWAAQRAYSLPQNSWSRTVSER